MKTAGICTKIRGASSKIALAAMAICAAGLARAATWQGGASGTLDDAANWDGDIATSAMMFTNDCTVTLSSDLLGAYSIFTDNTGGSGAVAARFGKNVSMNLNGFTLKTVGAGSSGNHYWRAEDASLTIYGGTFENVQSGGTTNTVCLDNANLSRNMKLIATSSGTVFVSSYENRAIPGGSYIGGALCMAGDAISVKRLVDKPQAEFWGYQTEGNYDIKDCSSAAHLYGKQIASGEAFTDITYKHTLADIKNLADYAYAFGINEFVVCAVAYQPWGRESEESSLKISTANGRQYVLNRLNTLWPVSKPFWDYQARCSWMLRQGKPVSDFCLYLGDDIPARILGHKLPAFPQGYDFDAFTTDALKNRMTVKDGRIVLPDGVSYSMMILPQDGKQTEETKKLIDNFRQQGVAVYDPQTDKRSLTEAIREAGLVPDVDAPKSKNLYFCHRRSDNEDIYFLNNHSDDMVKDRFIFNSYAQGAELWNPVTGERTPLAITVEKGRVAIDLTLHARESYFVVLRGERSEVRGKRSDSYAEISREPWTVSFDPAMGGPAEPVSFDKLGDWTKHSDPRIKYFSGTAVCKNTFVLKKKDKQASYRLSLPLLNAAAEVIINGKSAGIVWCSPWDIDITRQLKKGKNQIELRVCNTLWNRLVGDAQLPEAERVTWQTHMLAKPGDNLVPSGFNGDITIEEVRGER